MTIYSFSTVFMAIIASNLLLALVALCFFSTKIMENAGCKLLFLFVLFTSLRFLLPFEVPFAIRYPIPEFLSKTLGQLQYFNLSIGSIPFSFWNICELFWVIGIFVGLVRYILLSFHTKHYIILHQKVLTNQEPYNLLLAQICEGRHKHNHFQVIELPGIETPMLYGIFSPRILIPENFQASDAELYCFISHEATHHFHHDLLLKFLVKLITIVYWWNPFCYILNERTDMVLEMRVDDSLTHSDSESTAIYTHCLLDMADRVIDHSNVPKILSMSFITKNKRNKTENLTKRIQMLMSNQQRKKPLINITLFAAVIGIFILSYAVILEGYYLPQPVAIDKQNAVISPESSYAIQNDDGTYDIYFNGYYMETVTSLFRYPEDIPVYTLDTLPDDVPLYTKDNHP